MCFEHEVCEGEKDRDRNGEKGERGVGTLEVEGQENEGNCSFRRGDEEESGKDNCKFFILMDRMFGISQ